jgi:hypothetical protein
MRQLTKCNLSFPIPDYLGWRSGDDRVFWNIAIHDAAGTNYCPATNLTCRQYHTTRANHYVVADNDSVWTYLRLINNELIAIADLFRSANDSAIRCEANMITNDNIALARREMIETADCTLQAKTDSAAT